MSQEREIGVGITDHQLIYCNRLPIAVFPMKGQKYIFFCGYDLMTWIWVESQLKSKNVVRLKRNQLPLV